jgi:hypothetical protein
MDLYCPQNGSYFTRHRELILFIWSGDCFGRLLLARMVMQAVALTDTRRTSCGGDRVVKIWGPGWSTKDLNLNFRFILVRVGCNSRMYFICVFVMGEQSWVVGANAGDWHAKMVRGDGLPGPCNADDDRHF